MKITDTEIEKGRIAEISTLHNEVGGLLKLSLDKGIRIGELLTEQKASLQHGEFTSWVKANLPFTDRTARNYMRLYQNRNLLKTETVSDLTPAYRLLASENKTEKPLKPGDAGYLDYFFSKYRSREHRLVEMEFDIEEGETQKELMLIHDEAIEIQNDSMEDHLLIARYLGELHTELDRLTK